MNAPLRPVHLGAIDTEVEHRADGSVLMRLREPLGSYPMRHTDRLVQWAREVPDRVLLGRRPPGGPATGAWSTLSYAQTLACVRAIAQALIDRGLGPNRPVMILSENDFENQLLALACTHVGVLYIPVSPAYALMSVDYAKLHFLNRKCEPGLVFAASASAYGKAVAAAFPQAEFVATDESGAPAGLHVTPFAALVSTRPTSAVDQAFDAVTADTVAKVLFTSGTTGEPKGVMLTHRMLCSNRQQVMQAMPFMLEEPPVAVDWLPWHHTFGGTNNFGNVMYAGGSFYIDSGKPLPEGVQPTVDALREISPTIYWNTPAGFSALLPYLRSDAALRKNFFRRLKFIYYGGAVLPKPTWAALDEVAVAELGERILICSGIGSTECGPTPTTTSWDPRREPMVGLPLPGVEVKLAPVNDKIELRLKGPCITPGYWKEEQRTREAFDEEGYFRLGDAVAPIDPEHLEKGLRYDGRIAENFKLSSGTWVHVGSLRDRLMGLFSPLVRDAVLCGEGKDQVGALLFPDFAACRALDATLPVDASPEHILQNAAVRDVLQQRLDSLAASGTGSAGRVTRVSLETEPATLDTGEMTAKSSISSATVLRRRAATIQALHDEASPGPRVLRARQQK